MRGVIAKEDMVEDTLVFCIPRQACIGDTANQWAGWKSGVLKGEFAVSDRRVWPTCPGFSALSRPVFCSVFL